MIIKRKQNLLGLESNKFPDVKCNTESLQSCISALKEIFKNTKFLNKSNRISIRPVKKMIKLILKSLKNT